VAQALRLSIVVPWEPGRCPGRLAEEHRVLLQTPEFKPKDYSSIQLFEIFHNYHEDFLLQPTIPQQSCGAPDFPRTSPRLSASARQGRCAVDSDESRNGSLHS